MTLTGRTTETTSLTVGIGPLALAVHVPRAVEAPLRSQIEPFMTRAVDQCAEAPLLELDLHLETAPAEWQGVREGLRVAVDTSLYRHLASDGLRFTVNGGFVVRIEHTQSHVFFASAERHVVLLQPNADLLALDGVRTIKSLLTPWVEVHGGVQLHSAAVTLEDGRAVLVLGDMWQGKTTLLLELMSGFRVGQLSCDTVVLLPDANGGLSVHGWPSPFSVSQGTLSDHPELASFFPADRRHVPYDTLWREGQKSVLTSAEVVERFSTSVTPSAFELAHCLIARFRPDETTGLTPITDAGELAGELRSVYLGSRDPIYHNWHSYVVADEAVLERNIAETSERLLCACPVTVMTWAPGPASLLKRIPDLGRAHKHLGQLLTAF